LLGAGGEGREDDGRRRHQVVGAVMLSDREEVEAELVGKLGFLEQVAHALLGAQVPDVSEGREAELQPRR
jgi:hypothetical protein